MSHLFTWIISEVSRSYVQFISLKKPMTSIGGFERNISNYTHCIAYHETSHGCALPPELRLHHHTSWCCNTHSTQQSSRTTHIVFIHVFFENLILLWTLYGSFLLKNLWSLITLFTFLQNRVALSFTSWVISVFPYLWIHQNTACFSSCRRNVIHDVWF